PQLQQAIRLLQLSRLELIDEVRRELDNNPVLSEDEPDPKAQKGEAPEARNLPREESMPDAEYPPTDDRRQSEKAAREVDWEKFLENRTLHQQATGMRGGFEDLPPIEQNLTRPRTLPDHLL